MKITNKIYHYTDRIISPILDRLVSEEDVSKRMEAEKRFFESENSMDYTITTLSAIHDRASSMVSHLSLMLGVCLFLMPGEILESGSVFERIVILIDAFVYIFLVLLTVRCLKSIGLDQDYQSREMYLKHAHMELVFKYRIMEVVNSFTIVATVVLVLALLFGLIPY